MFKQLVFAAIIVSSINAIGFEARRKETDTIPGVPQSASALYLRAFADLKEIDPKTGEIFEWSDTIDYEFFGEDSDTTGIITRYKKAIIHMAHLNSIAPEDLAKAQAMVNQNSGTLFSILNKDGVGTLDPGQWTQYWTQFKREIAQQNKEADAKCL